MPAQAIRRYHTVAMSLHWLIAVLILTNLVMGLLFQYMERADRFALMQLHKSFGITVLLLTCVRLGWRLLRGAPPELPSLQGWELWAARAVHFLIYVLMFAIPFSGWVLVSSSPLHLPTVLYWSISWPHLPFLDNLSDAKAFSHQAGQVHAWLAYGMIGLLALHVGAALRHHWMLRDETLFRMTPVFLENILRRLRGEKA